MNNEYLVLNGDSRALIVIGAQCTGFYCFIAGEIQRYLRAITGATLQIVTDDAGTFGASAQNVIAVGGPAVNAVSRQVLAQSSTRFDAADLGSEGFVLRSGGSEAGRVIVAAGAGEAGTMYAAYELLERYGVTFEISGDILPEQTRTLELLELDLKMIPAFKYRGLHPFWNHLLGFQSSLSNTSQSSLPTRSASSLARRSAWRLFFVPSAPTKRGMKMSV